MDTDKKIQPLPVSMPNVMFDDTLNAGFELRVDSIRSHIKVLAHPGGLCEVFGRELPAGEPVFFHAGENIAIFCWKQTRIQICGEFEAYVSEQTPMHVYLNISSALNKMRNEALTQKRVGPSLLVTGSTQSGKSTLCKMLVNYSLKLGWSPVFADIDLQSGEISPPGSISAAMLNPGEDLLPSDSLHKKAISYFHGKTEFVTQEFFSKQVSELADAVKQKFNNDLKQFKNQFHLEQLLVETHDPDTKGSIQALQEIVAPVFPALYASGCVINGFTPQDRTQTETLVKAIIDFNADVVLVIDHEKLEKDILNIMRQKQMQSQSGKDAKTFKMPIILKVPKSPGIQPSRLNAEEQERRIVSHYEDYFRGKHHATFQKNEHVRAELELEALAVRNELDPQPVNLPIDQIRVFRVLGSEIPLSALPAGSTQPEWTTIVEEIKPSDLDKPVFKNKGLACLAPRDLALLKQLEVKMAQNPSTQLMEDFQEQLLRSCTSEFLMMREFKTDLLTQKKYLEVLRSCVGGSQLVNTGASVGDGRAGAQPNTTAQSRIEDHHAAGHGGDLMQETGSLAGFSSNYFIISDHQNHKPKVLERGFFNSFRI